LFYITLFIVDWLSSYFRMWTIASASSSCLV